MEFRLLRADEIECRVAMVQSWGISLLLYKDARCDQNILDETVGPFNWQRHHSRDNANCIVSIWDAQKQQWIEKEDTGTESNTEKEKGLASDSFKRACFNWGIGRELYTSPKMFVTAKDLQTLKQENGRWTCKDYFRVIAIEYNGRRIAKVDVLNEKTGCILTFGEPVVFTEKREAVKTQSIGPLKAEALRRQCEEKSVDTNVILKQYKVNDLSDLTEEQHGNIIRRLEKSSGSDRKA